MPSAFTLSGLGQGSVTSGADTGPVLAPAMVVAVPGPHTGESTWIHGGPGLMRKMGPNIVEFGCHRVVQARLTTSAALVF